jgi:aminomethyltransferase
MEAGMPLYGNDIDDSINPLEARLEFSVKLDKPEFIGKEPLIRSQRDGLMRNLVGIRMVEGAIPREGFNIFLENEKVGRVTSGTFSPTIKTGIALGHINRPFPCGTEVAVEIRGNRSAGIIVETPFYDQDKFGWKRKPQSI